MIWYAELIELVQTLQLHMRFRGLVDKAMERPPVCQNLTLEKFNIAMI